MADAQQPPTPPQLEQFAILLDSSFLVALGIPEDAHNRSAQSLLGALTPYSPMFYVPNIVIAETVGKLMKRCDVSAAEAIRRFRKVVARFPQERHGGSTMEWSAMFARYTKFSRKTLLRKLDTNDFVVVTEGILLGAKIITCDAGMYATAQKAFPGCIYFVSDTTDSVKDGSAKLLSAIKAFHRTHRTPAAPATTIVGQPSSVAPAPSAPPAP